MRSSVTLAIGVTSIASLVRLLPGKGNGVLRSTEQRFGRRKTGFWADHAANFRSGSQATRAPAELPVQKGITLQTVA